MESAEYGAAGEMTTYGNKAGLDLLEKKDDMEERLNRLEGWMVSKDAQTKRLEDRMADKDTQVTDLQGQIVDLKDRIVDLKDQVADIHHRACSEP